MLLIFGFLLVFIFSGALARAELAGIGIIFGLVLISIILIPVYAVILKSLRGLMQSPNWDYYFLYPFVLINGVILLIGVAHLIQAYLIAQTYRRMPLR